MRPVGGREILCARCGAATAAQRRNLHAHWPRPSVELAGRERFDLILMDVQMPVMGGFEATRIIRERERASGGRIPIVALTARAMKGDRELCLAAGMDGYLTKPLRAAELYAAVEALGSHSAGPAADPDPATETLLDRFLGDRELLRAVGETFIEHLPVLLGDLDGAVARGDLEAVQRAAHSLKGSAGNFGHAPSFEAALRLEHLADGRDVPEACSEIHRAVDDLVRMLRDSIGEPVLHP